MRTREEFFLENIQPNAVLCDISEENSRKQSEKSSIKETTEK